MDLKHKIDKLFSHDRIPEEWKQSEWNRLIDWLGDFDLADITNPSVED
jgi:hypothetical protein